LLYESLVSFFIPFHRKIWKIEFRLVCSVYFLKMLLIFSQISFVWLISEEIRKYFAKR